MTQVHNTAGRNEEEPLISQSLADKLLDLAYTGAGGELQLVELHEGEVLFHQGDEAQAMYVLRAGMLGVRVQHADGGETNIARLVAGAIVGELALLSGNRRSATVYAVNDAGLICISQEQFQKLMLEDESALAEMSETAVPRWQRQQLFNALRRLLGDVDPGALEALRQQMTWHFFANGDVVFLQGDPADGMYIVVNGRLQTSLLQDDGTVKDLGRIGPGEPVGEMAVIVAAERSATVHAVRDSNLVRITPPRFQRLIRQHPSLLINITRVIIERQQRLMYGSSAEKTGQLTLVVIPAAVNIDALQFAEHLSTAFARCGSTLVLDSGRFDERYGEELASQTEVDDVGNTAIVAYMNELDLAGHYIIYVADPFPSAWTRRCIGQSDRVLVLADLAGDPKPGDAERVLDELSVPLACDLLFWTRQGLDGLPDLTAWKTARPGVPDHVVEQGDERQLDELVKQLTTNN
jgi:CRP-like cAMP-binding protein